MKFASLVKKQIYFLLGLTCVAASAQVVENIPQLKADMELVKRRYEERLANPEARLSTKALVNGNLILRDAQYRYNEKIGKDGFLIFLSAGCDIFQVVLTVNKGSAGLLITEANTADESAVQNGSFIYPDVLVPQSGMFSYTLYTNNLFKGISILDPGAAGGEVTAFGYCFSTNSAADMAFRDGAGQIFE